MRLDLHRIQSADNFTTGYIKINGEFECYTLEDEHRWNKIEGRTKIPAGRYLIGARKTLSPMTKFYRDKFDWFTFHIMIKNIPHFNYVYLYIGNDREDNEGCILVGSSINTEGYLGSSLHAYKEIYQKIMGALKNGEPVQIYIHD